MTVQSSSPRNRKLWLAACKPPMYSVAIMPIGVGSTVAYWEWGHLDGRVLATFVLSAVLILAWENLTNDVFDAATGIDVNKHHSMVNLTGSRGLVFGLGMVCLGAGLAGIVSIAWQQRDPTVLILIALCCLLGYAYQGPPLRLGYQGLGEGLCFLAFGPLGVGAAYYSQTQTWSWASQGAGLVVGLTVTLVLFCSHFHQVEDDLAAGKRSPIVRLGTARGAAILPWWCALAFGVVALGIALGRFPAWTALTAASLYPAWQLCRHVGRYHNQPDRVSTAKFYAIGFQFWNNLLLLLGFVLGGWL